MGTEMKIDNPCPDGSGEICFCGRHVFMGYFNEERKTREIIDDGWLHSGDIGWVDQSGIWCCKNMYLSAVLAYISQLFLICFDFIKFNIYISSSMVL